MLLSLEASSDWGVQAMEEVRLLIQYLESGGPIREEARRRALKLLQLIEKG